MSKEGRSYHRDSAFALGYKACHVSHH